MIIISYLLHLTTFSDTLAGDFGGAVYLFDYNDGTGNFEYTQKLTPDPDFLDDLNRYGSSVSISGNYVVVGDPAADKGGSNAGAAYVFQKGDSEEDSFNFAFSLVSPIPAVSALFGHSVAVNSNGVIAIGAKGDRIARGSVYLFKPNGADWDHVFTIAPDDVAQSFPNVGNFGWDVAIDDS